MRNLFFAVLLACLVGWGTACHLTKQPATGPGVTVTDAAGQPVTISDTSRIVTANTSVTETVYALGVSDRIVAVDNSSTEYIKEAANKPKVGSFRSLSAEGILALKPTLLIATADTGPPEALQQLKAAGVPVLTVPTTYTTESVKERVKTIAHALNLDAQGNELTALIDRDLADVAELLKKAKNKPKVMFCGRGPNAPNATIAGRNTTVDTMITLAGAENPLTGFEGSRPMTDEAVVAAQPDIILMTEKAFERSGGVDGVLQFPGVRLTPAGKNRHIVPVSDMYYMGFGPGIGKAVKELAVKFHPELAAK